MPTRRNGSTDQTVYAAQLPVQLSHAEERSRDDATIHRFFSLVKNNKITRALVLAIPYVGHSLAELIYHDDRTGILEEIWKESEERQSKILDAIKSLVQPHAAGDRPIVVVGGANAERILYTRERIELGSKHSVQSGELIGGGGVNYATRLLTAGCEVLPLLALGADRTGAAIQTGLAKTASSCLPSDIAGRASSFIQDGDFLIQGYRTPESTILVSHGQRTILTERATECHFLAEHLRTRLLKVEAVLGERNPVVMVGHLPTVPDTDARDDATDVTSIVVNHFHERYKGQGTICVNFGLRQLAKGFSYWENLLPKISYLQFNLAEARQFLSRELPHGRLGDIVDFLRDRGATSMITLDKFGAVGNFETGAHGVIFAWPVIDQEDEVKDPTGTGDAFAAGLASVIRQAQSVTFTDFYNGLLEARLWAAYACTTLGGSASSPDRRLLDVFSRRSGQCEPIETLSRPRAEQWLRLIDKANR